jgi:hypothetical protein
MNFRDLTAKPHHVLTPGQLAESVRLMETEIHIRWDQEAFAVRCEDEANIEEALDALKVSQQP